MEDSLDACEPLGDENAVDSAVEAVMDISTDVPILHSGSDN